MEVLVSEIDIHDCILELTTHTNNTDSVPAQNFVLSRDKLWYTVRQECRLSVKADLVCSS